MAEGGWKCCCCTVKYYDFCECLGYDSDWLTREWNETYTEGLWECNSNAACALTGYSLIETTGSGRLINRIPLTKNHSARVQATRALAIGESIYLYLAWKDASNHVKVALTRTGALTGTSGIYRIVDGVETAVEECEIECSSVAGVPFLYGCIQGGLVIARTTCCTLKGVAESTGPYAGFGHSASSAMPYSLFIIYEQDPPEYKTLKPYGWSDVFCSSCAKCITDGGTLIPPELTATIVASSGCDALLNKTWTLRWVRKCKPGQKCKDVGGDEGVSCVYTPDCPSEAICPGDPYDWFPWLEFDGTGASPMLDIVIENVTVTDCGFGSTSGTIELLDQNEEPLWWLWRWHLLNGYNGLTHCCTEPTCTECYVDFLITE